MSHNSTDDSRSQRPSESYLSSLIRWLQLKNYQYEVTFSLYMLTSTEKCIFNLVLFVLVSMLVVAASMYLPNHVSIMYRRIWYYMQGEVASITKSGGAAVGEVVKTAVSSVGAGEAEMVTATGRAIGEL